MKYKATWKSRHDWLTPVQLYVLRAIAVGDPYVGAKRAGDFTRRLFIIDQLINWGFVVANKECTKLVPNEVGYEVLKRHENRK